MPSLELGWVIVWTTSGDRAFLQEVNFGNLPVWGTGMFAKRFAELEDATRTAETIRRSFPFEDVDVEREEEIKDEI